MHNDKFTETSTTAEDHALLEQIHHAAHQTNKHDFFKSNKKQDRAHAMYSVREFFSNLNGTFNDDQRKFMYLELKNDFMEYVFSPCLCCTDADETEETYPGPMNATFLCILLFTSLFYLLCLIWLFQARIALQNAPSILKQHINYYCDFPTIGSLNKIENYYIFRLTIYLVSPLVLIVIAYASHRHHQVMVRRLTGLPREDDVEHSCWIKWWPRIAIIAVFVINILFGMLTIVFDCLFLTQMDTFSASDKPNIRDCTKIFKGELFQNTTAKFDNLLVPIASVPIPLVLFNFFYTTWGILFCIAVWRRPSVFTDSQTQLLASLEYHNAQNKPLNSMHHNVGRLEEALKKHMGNITHRPAAPAPPAALPHAPAPPAAPPHAPASPAAPPLPGPWHPPPPPAATASASAVHGFQGYHAPALGAYVAPSYPDPLHAAHTAQQQQYYPAPVTGSAHFPVVYDPRTGQYHRVSVH